MIRVLHVIPTVAPRYGGPAAAIWPMLQALSRIPDLNVELVTTPADGPDRSLTPSDLPQVDFRVHLVNGTERWAGEMTPWLSANMDRFDLVQIHGLWHHHGLMAGRAARRRNRPYLIRTCGMLAPYSWQRRWWKKRPYWWLFERKHVRSAAGYHVTTPPEKDEVAAWNLPAPISEIPLGMDDAAVSTPVDTKSFRDRCGPEAANRPIVLFLGRLHPVKAIADMLLPAFARLKTDAYLALVGGTDASVPEYEQIIRTTIQQLNLSTRVGLLGPVKPTEKWACYDAATVLVQSSRTENFGMSVAEAMARGCPVVVTEGVQSHPLVTEAGAGLVVPFQVDRLAAALDDLLENPAKRDRLGNAGRTYCRERLTWDRVAGQMMAMYQRTLRTNSRSADKTTS